MIVPSAEQIARGIEMSYEVLSVFERMHDEDSADIKAAWAEAKRQTQDAIQSVLDTLSQELERLKEENTELLTRSGKPDGDRDFSIHAATDMKG